MSDLSDIWPQLLALAGLVAASAFFSGTEVALFSLRRIDKDRLKTSDKKRHRLVSRMLGRPRRLITTILLGNEVVNVSISVLIASIAPVIYPIEDEISLALVSTFTALPILLCFGEIVPKTIAIRAPHRWATVAAGPLAVWAALTFGLRFFIRWVVIALTYPFGVRRGNDQKSLSEEEFRTLVDAGSEEGQVDARERRLIHRVFEFDDKTVGQVMIPKSKIFALSYDLARPQLVAEVAARGYSRVPIYSRSLDNIRGLLFAKDLVAQAVEVQPPLPLNELLHRPLYVPITIKCERLFRMFKQRRTHMALVVNEYGKLVGIVTMEDLLEELFGEIRDEREQQKAAPRKRETMPPMSDEDARRKLGLK